MTKGLCHVCFTSGVCTTIDAKLDGLPKCTKCLKKESAKPVKVEYCNCKECPVHNDIVIEPVPLEVPEG